MTALHADPEALAAEIVARAGRDIVLGLPVGLGKALHVANALYRLAERDPSVRLTIFTGLTLTRPQAASALEARLLEPIAERLYGGWPRVAYEEAQRCERLPPNVTVREFYLRPGAWLGNPTVQQSYTSINYSEVADELLDLGVNVIAQLVATDPGRPGYVSLACNPEVTLDLLPRLRARQERPFLFVGQLNTSLPYMPGAAELPDEAFDFLLAHPDLDHPLFPLPNRKVTPADYATGMHVASLVPDGGTLQLGIGSLSDAVAHCLKLRNREPQVFRSVLERLPGGSNAVRRQVLPIEDRPFERGLYACSELLSDALFTLYESGILRRPAGAGDDALVHAGFFLGSGALYAGLAALPSGRRRQIAMSPISFVNTLYGDEAAKRRQREGARFVNECMMATLLGAAVSDGLDDGRVVSGIGGQFDFVRMAADLGGAHSILMLRARRVSGGATHSNIRWTYGHTSVPRQHRDLFVTEYGIAATRGRPDAAVIDAMLQIADAEFQPGLLAAARDAGKVAANHALDDRSPQNTPAAVAAAFSDDGVAGHFPPYPLGSAFTPVEERLVDALSCLARATATRRGRLVTAARALLATGGAEHAEALARLGLDDARGPRAWLTRRLVIRALEEAP
ncbi:MAG TPA: acetyl-CoA hydrolase/transferase C-terminal domain-containing protein [Woeseiaceae bacterium]|nr:acetyl-CoA hydrolase/transferase C-terminal domain-containing protein [Woeseiaceae bacterium]